MKIIFNLRAGLLFLMIIFLSLVSAYYNFSIENDTEDILKANYNTLEYSRNMLLSLDKTNLDKEKTIAVFQDNLTRQKGNITEVGEDVVTNNLQKNFDSLKKNWTDEALKSQIRQDIFQIMELNMTAAKNKNDIVKHKTETANLWIAILGILCFLIAFNLLLNLSNRITNRKGS
ncbi:hypothetical protein SAMN05444671_0763 [Flavobacterium sp. CF108]|uniref:hypothetical protein n=1 Tax=unclassified Flavobacterium TaxID=196869 RepID=UPI0008C30A80|nr:MULTISPECIES: hypothetical protein [unclassified Flavobacterium]SEO18396.1 hypothetical protein SAMN04487978_2315 [Flavobacterium sp. fv08]SHG54795.1 hypothetical protein SAMN05444671_0763 [Flavobacterium sp. CF108]